MATEEKVFNIPLRAEWVKKSRVARANRSVDTVRFFLKRHTKSDEVKLSQSLNESLWVGGAKRPPAFAKVKVVKDEKGKIIAMLPEEKLEFTEKKGLRHKLLRKKGDMESKIVREDEKAEPVKPIEVVNKKEVPQPSKHTEPKTEAKKEDKAVAKK